MKNIRMLVEEAAKIYGKKTFIYYKEQEVSFQALNDLTNKTANAFLAAGIKKGDRVAIMLLNRPEFLYIWFGLNKIGASMVPLNTAFTAYEVEYQLNNSESKFVATDKDHYDTVNKTLDKCSLLGKIILLDSDIKPKKGVLFDNFIRDQPIELKAFEINTNDEAAILYTSGTTGNPKGCIADQFYYLNAGRAYVREQIITSEDRILTPLPLFHMNAQIISTIVALLSGASLILIDRFHSSTWWDDIKKYKATIFHYLGVIPSILMSLPERKDDYHQNTLYGVGGGVLKDIHEKFERRFNVQLLEIYGSTEAGGLFLTRRGAKDRKVGTGCFGRLFPEAEAMIVDDDDRELPDGQIGELVTRSSDPNNRRKGYFRGYLKDPEATAKAWKNGWFHTGDFCKRDAEGYYYFVDRKKDMIRRSGENISATEVESVILLHPKVQDVAAIAVPDKLRVEEVKVYIVAKEGQDLKPEDIIHWCEERLAYYKIPRYIEFRKDLHKTETQKIKKLVLKKEKDDLTKACWDRTVHMKLKREKK
jgi:crotonobetaine/carnitine-CoA ligase